MKHHLNKRLISALLTLSMILCLLPAVVQAADVTNINEVSVEFNPERLPKAGRDVTIVGDELLSDDAGRPYRIGKGTWYSDIPNGYDNDSVRHFYEINETNESIGYCFEAGKTYLYGFICTIKSDFKDTHKFVPKWESGSRKFTISNLPESSYSVVAIESHYDFFRVYVAFTVDGVCPYEDITQVNAKWDSYFAHPPRAGRQSAHMIFNYGNFSVARKWEGSFDNSPYGATYFKAGEHYTYTATLTARDGYRFSSDVNFVFPYGDPDSIKLSDDRKQLTVVYEYDVSDVVYIDKVELNNTIGEQLLPSASIGLMDCHQLSVTSDYLHESAFTGWKDEAGNPKTSLHSGDIVYFTERINVRDTDTHKFSKDVTGVITGIPEDSYTVQTKWIDHGTVELTFIFAEGYTRKVGRVAEEPVNCSTYFGLKWALEHPDMRYVTMSDCTQTLPLIQKEEGDSDQLINAINVSTNKYLQLLGDVQFTATEVDETAYLAYKNLIGIPEGSKLVLSGEGSLTYKSYHPDADNAPLRVNYGELIVDGCTVTAVTTKGGTYAPAIGNVGGEVTIKSGTFNGYNDSSMTGAAVMVAGGSTVIENGRFETFGSGINYGLCIFSQNSAVTIDRGLFYSKGIFMPSSVTNLSKYVDTNHVIDMGHNLYAPDEVSQAQIDSNYIIPVKVCRIVDRANVTVRIPVAGETVDTSPEVSEGFKVASVKWYANNSAIAMSNSSKFAQNSTYRVVVTLTADAEALCILDKPSQFTGKINGKSVTVTAGYDGYELSYSFGQCKNALTSLSFTGLTVPKEYADPDRSIASDTDTSGKAHVSEVFWYEDGVLMESGALFKENRFYVMKMRVIADPNYIFNVDADGVPMMDCSVSGIQAYSENYEDYAGTRYAMVVVEFGYLADSVIDHISLNVDIPVAGEKPHYHAYPNGQYAVDTNKHAYDEEYVGPNTGHRYYYQLAGISWYDKTDSSYVYEDETFIAGHEYALYVKMVPGPGLEFLYKSVPFSDDLLVAASVNGEAAEAAELGINGLQSQNITYRFVCEPATIRTVEISDLASPVAGRNPDYTMVLGGETYQPKADFGTNNTGIEWYTGSGDLLKPEDTFVEGETYMVRLRIEPVEIDGNKMCKFYNGTAISLNGTNVKETNSNLINRNTNRVELFYYYGPTPAALDTPENGWWQNEVGKWYFFENGNMVKNDWRKDSVGWCYLLSDGSMATNMWVQDSKGWCYVEANGYCATNCWKQDSTGWVWLDGEGSMVKSSWIQDGGKWYYLDENGYMVYNQWKQDSQGWCWLGTDGAMVTNTWIMDSKGWCYIGADGYCWTNCWAKDSHGWVWLDSEGSMVYNQWVQDGGNWYYVDSDGYMLYSTSILYNDKTYYFDASGICTNP